MPYPLLVIINLIYQYSHTLSQTARFVRDIYYSAVNQAQNFPL